MHAMHQRSFCNDPYDWDGPKEPVVYACEADCDAALTMQILKLLTHDPVIFMDVRHYDAENDVMVFCNCGSQSTYYAGGERRLSGKSEKRFPVSGAEYLCRRRLPRQLHDAPGQGYDRPAVPQGRQISHDPDSGGVRDAA